MRFSVVHPVMVANFPIEKLGEIQCKNNIRFQRKDKLFLLQQVREERIKQNIYNNNQNNQRGARLTVHPADQRLS